MLKISAALLLACTFSVTSATALEVTAKTVHSPLQQVAFTTQKSMVGQVDGISTVLNSPLREKVMIQNDSSEPTSTTAKIGLLATALLCFVLRSSRRKV